MTAAPVGFDLDMTLIDSRSTVLDSFAALAEESQRPIDLEVVNARLGLKLEDELAHWFAAEQIDEAAAIYRRHYLELAAGSTSALPGAVAALAAVTALGLPTLIVTAKHPISVPTCLEAAGLVADEVVAFVHGPEKAAALRARGAQLYVGDTPADMQAACDADAFGLGVTTGSFGRTALLVAGATVVLTSLEAFPEWLLGVSVDLRGSRVG